MRGQLDFKVKHYPGGPRKVLFLFGFGCNEKQPGLKWFMDRLLNRDYDLTCVQLPTDISDLKGEVLGRLEDIEEVIGGHVAVGFSYGGLALSFLFKAKRRIFISPFWGVNERWRMKGDEVLATALSIVPKPLIKRKFDTRDAGQLAVEEDLYGIPERLSFSFVHQFFEAQKVLPNPRPDDYVFYSKKDMIVSSGSIEERIKDFNMDHEVYDGGHLFYLDENREEVVIRILKEIDLSFDPSGK